MALCPSCRTRKGKRACPALRSAICSVCCGEKRVVEIACPAGCVYLERGTENEILRVESNYVQHQEPGKAMRWLRAMERLGFLLEAIQRVVAATVSAGVEDRELLAALQSARMTLDAEAKGILYEDAPTSPTALALARGIAGGVRALQRAAGEAAVGGMGEASRRPRWGPAEAALILEVLAERCAYHVERRGEAGSFVTHLRRIHPPSESGAPPAEPPRIILA